MAEWGADPLEFDWGMERKVIVGREGRWRILFVYNGGGVKQTRRGIRIAMEGNDGAEWMIMGDMNVRVGEVGSLGE